MFIKKNKSAKYRAQGLTMMQASKLANASSGVTTSQLTIAGLGLVAVGCLAFIGMQQTSGSGDAQVADTTAQEPGPSEILMVAIDGDPEAEAARLTLMSGTTEKPSLDQVQELTQPDPVQVASTPAQLNTQQGVEASATIEAPAIVEQAPVTQVAAVALAPVEISPSCFVQLVKVAQDSTVFFAIGSAQLKGEDLTKLRQIGSVAQDCPDARLQVTGHSDSTGNDLINMNLSWQRADNTVAALSQLGIDASRFEPVGFGARAPLSQGDSSDEDLNRRVEFVVLRTNGGS